MPVSHYEDLEVWKMAFELTKSVYAVSKRDPFARDFVLRDQVRRASISTIANIAEGFARISKREFIRFLDIARASTMEVQSLLHVALSEAYITRQEFDEMYKLCERLRFGLGALIRLLRSQL